MAIKRNQLLHFLNTGTVQVPAYNLMNTGITSLSLAKNPSVVEEGYIGDAVGTKILESLAPETSFEINVDANDPVSVYLTDMEWEDKVMDETYTDYVTVQMWKPGTGTPVVYPAKKYNISVMVETIGDEALKTLKHSVKFGIRGNAIMGKFNPTDKTFTAD